MRQIIAIGGGGFGRNPNSSLVENYILNQVKKKKPNICFVPTATGDSDAYKVNFYATFSRLSCNVSHIDFFKRTKNLQEIVNNQDIFFIGGGNTKSMLAVWRDWNFDQMLKKAYQNGTLMSGVSAGAICWFGKGITDSWEKELKIINCLSFINGTCCPHYDEEPERRPFVHKLIKEKIINECFSIEGGAALHFVDEKIKTSLSFERKKKTYITLEKKLQIKDKPIITVKLV